MARAADDLSARRHAPAGALVAAYGLGVEFVHANAALSLIKRRMLCRRVVEEDRTLTKAAAAAEVLARRRES